MSEENTPAPDGTPNARVDDQLDYEQTLAYTQRFRRWAVGQMTQKGMPADPQEANVLLKALKDMDTTALTDRRNNIEQDNADTDREVVEAMKTFIGMQENADPFRRGSQGGNETPPPPELEPEKLGEQSMVDGETEVGVVNETSKDFMKRMEGSEDD